MSFKSEDERHFHLILETIFKSKGFDGHQYKPNYVKRRIAVRMRASGASTYGDYLKVLQRDPRESAALLDRLTIHVTEFFRDPEVYQAIREKFLPELMSRISSYRLRVWCAGCSTGEEPYSMAILLKQWMVERPEYSFSILATDLDRTSVETAERGEYPREAVARMASSDVSKWFYTAGKKVQVVPELRRCVKFMVSDLLGGWESLSPPFDLILCRNLLIYLTGPQHQSLYERFAGALAPGGYLVLGRTEALLGKGRRNFKCVDVKNRVYHLEAALDEGSKAES